MGSVFERVNMISICFVLLLTVCGASKDVRVYSDYDVYEYKYTTGFVLWTVFEFGYHSSDVLFMDIYLKNEDPDVKVEVYFKHPSGDEIKWKNLHNSKRKKYIRIHRSLKFQNFSIVAELCTKTGFCTRKQIVKAKNVTGLPKEINDTPYNDICLKEKCCVIEVDLSDTLCTGTDNITLPSTASGNPPQPSSASLSAVLAYAIPSAIVMCVLLVVMFIGVKKYCHRNSPPVDTIELNTYSTANELVYADLGFVQGDGGGCQQARRDDESPYAEVIGVLKEI